MTTGTSIKIACLLEIAIMLFLLAGCRPWGMRTAITLPESTVSAFPERRDLGVETTRFPDIQESATTIETGTQVRQAAFKSESNESGLVDSYDSVTNLEQAGLPDNAEQSMDELYVGNSLTLNANSAPRTVDDALPSEFWELSLDEAIRIGLQNATVLKSLGGLVLSNPEATNTVFEPGLQYTDPVFGVEAALSQFDARLSSDATYQKNDDVFNNPFTGGGLFSPVPVEVERENFDWNLQLSKTTATGTQFSLTRSLHHDYQNPQLANIFVGSWTNALEGSVRQPLLQGAGVMFNRIAGPNGQPGFRFSNGVIIAQINDKISVTEFEQGVQNYLEEIINAYWRLYLAYHNYEAALRARNTGYKTWRIAEARFQAELNGGEADREAQAREQLLLFDQEVLTALGGNTPLSPSGQQTGGPGVYQAEANLRLLLGLPNREGGFIKPSEQPVEARVVYDWGALSNQAASNRLELRRQKLRVKQREFELLASKNFLLPRLDAVGTYRIYGFGDDLIGGGPGRFSSAVKDFYGGDHHQSQVGLQLSVPLGYRRQLAGLRNAELNLQRERAILDEQQDQVQFQLGNAVRQTAHDYQALRNAYNRLVAADQAEQARFVSFEADKSPLDFLLEAQTRRAQAENAYHRAVVDYELGRVEVQNEAGVLLSDFGVQFSGEGARR